MINKRGHSHANKGYLDQVRGQNTGDQAIPVGHVHRNLDALEKVKGTNTGDQTASGDHSHTNLTALNAVSGVNSGDQTLHTHANQAALDAILGVNTGDQGFTGGFIRLTSAYTLANSVALQKLFNAPANGAFTALANRTYFFECNFILSGMSTTSGTFSFGFLGTAVYTRVYYQSIANKAVVTATATVSRTGTVATILPLVAANTVATGKAVITGNLTIGTGGTIIPAVAFSVGIATVQVAVDSYFRIWDVGANNVQSVGAWS